MEQREHRFELTPVRRDGVALRCIVCPRCRSAWASVRDPKWPGRPVWRVVDDEGNLESVGAANQA